MTNFLKRLLSRRDLFGTGAVAALAPLTRGESKPLYHESIYTRLLGVRPLLSCRGHTTIYGGSLMPAEVLRAMEEANDQFVDMYELSRLPDRYRPGEDCGAAGVPVLIDAASELPPVSSLTHYTTMGADLTVISGGKGLLGPQSTGILAGRKDLIEAAALNHSPNANIGRGMKVGKEEIVGLIAALNRYVDLDHETVMETWNRKARFMADQLKDVPGVKAEYRINGAGFGEMRLTWDRNIIPLTGKEAFRKLMSGEPRILYYEDDEGGTFQTRCMKDGDEILASRRLRQFFLEEARKA